MIKISIVNLTVKRVLVDNGNSTNILFLETFKNMQLDERMMRRKVVSLVGFDDKATSTIGEIKLSMFTEGINLHTAFSVISLRSAYNVILGRPWIHEMKAILSTYHQLIRRENVTS